MSVSRKKIIGLLGAGVGVMMLPSVGFANSKNGKINYKDILPLPLKGKTFIS